MFVEEEGALQYDLDYCKENLLYIMISILSGTFYSAKWGEPFQLDRAFDGGSCENTYVVISHNVAHYLYYCMNSDEIKSWGGEGVLVMR